MKAWSVIVVVSVMFLAQAGWGKTVGVWQVAPLYVNAAMVKTLDEAGWHIVTVGSTNLADGAFLDKLDVLFLPGGWEAYRFAGFQARRNLVRFVAGGKGLLDSDVETSQWPLFPQVGTTTEYIKEVRIIASGTSDLAVALGERFLLTNGFCLRVNAGPAGKVFAASGENPVGVYGAAYGGRYILFGCSLRGDINNMEKFIPPTLGAVESEMSLEKEKKGGGRRLPVFLDWLMAVPPLTAEEKSRQQGLADLEFLRQERLGVWTLNDNLRNGQLSLVPEIHSRLVLPLQKRLYFLNDVSRLLSGGNERCSALTNEIQQVMDQLNSRYKEVRSNVVVRTKQMELPELMEENPYVNAAGVLKRIEAAPVKSEAEKALLMALVNRCATDCPPLDAPLQVALYLHGQEISEQMLPSGRFSALLERCDKALSELRASIPAPAVAATVEERLRNDPLMMPYYTGNIMPTPQKAEYRNEFYPMSHVAIVVGKDVENPDPLVGVLAERIVRYGGRATVVTAPGSEHTAVVSIGDTELARQVSGLPSVPGKPEGYLIHSAQVGGKPVFILKGHDRLGVLWSIASLMQLIHWRDGQTLARAATVEDYPILQKRGLILSGSDFFHPARNRGGKIISYPNTELLLQQNRLLMLTAKINEPCYQQLIVADCYDYDWKHPEKMPADAHIEEDLAALGKSLTPLGITWWAGMRPHSAGDETSDPRELSHKLCADDESLAGLLYFARKAEEAGGHLSIILDDVRFPLTPYDKERMGTAREVDTWLVTRVMAQLKKEYPKARLLVGPPFYWGPLGNGWVIYGEDREAYLRMIGDKWQSEIEVFWTGRQVNAATLAVKEYYDWWMGLTKRKPYFWQNSNAYWCHMGRRHYPTDSLDSLWSNYWEGQFDVLGWYGFNGASLARYAVTDAISADFQWNPRAYSQDKEKSALRSVHEVAEKFVGQDSWPLLENVTRPLCYFDSFYLDPSAVSPKEYPKVKARLDQKAAKSYDVMEENRQAVYSSFKILQQRFPASLNAWTELGSFIGFADMVDGIKADPKLRLFRAAVTQRQQAQKTGEFVAERDVFVASADFDGGLLQEVLLDDLAKKKLQPVLGLGGPKCQATCSFPLNLEQVGTSHEVLLRGRQNATAGRLTLKLNGKTIFDGKAPFSKIDSSTARFPVPAGLATATNNVLVINLTIDTVMPGDGDGLDGAEAGSGSPLALQYAVFKCGAGNQ